MDDVYSFSSLFVGGVRWPVYYSVFFLWAYDGTVLNDKPHGQLYTGRFNQRFNSHNLNIGLEIVLQNVKLIFCVGQRGIFSLLLYFPVILSG